MTILHVSDLHYEKRWFHWLLHQAPAHDLLAISGDLLDLNCATPQRTQIAWVLDWLNAYPRPLCVCSGNHDLEWYDAVEHWVPAYWHRDHLNPRLWIDGQRVTRDGMSILAIGCTTHPKGGVADVWVVHAPPAGTLVSARNIGFEGGDPEMVEAVRRFAPRLVLTGHVHHPARWYDEVGSTLIFNPGSDRESGFPNHVVVETAALAARRVTPSGAEILPRLDAPLEQEAPPATQVLEPAA